MFWTSLGVRLTFKELGREQKYILFLVAKVSEIVKLTVKVSMKGSHSPASGL